MSLPMTATECRDGEDKLLKEIREIAEEKMGKARAEFERNMIKVIMAATEEKHCP